MRSGLERRTQALDSGSWADGEWATCEAQLEKESAEKTAERLSYFGDVRQARTPRFWSKKEEEKRPRFRSSDLNLERVDECSVRTIDRAQTCGRRGSLQKHSRSSPNHRRLGRLERLSRCELQNANRYFGDGRQAHGPRLCTYLDAHVSGERLFLARVRSRHSYWRRSVERACNDHMCSRDERSVSSRAASDSHEVKQCSIATRRSLSLLRRRRARAFREREFSQRILCQAVRLREVTGGSEKSLEFVDETLSPSRPASPALQRHGLRILRSAFESGCRRVSAEDDR